jgi:transcriptional antiterminator RfaH
MISEEAMAIPSWYVIHTNPKQEDRTNNNLRAWNIETFTPKIIERRFNQFTGETQCLRKPLFPRYIFVRFNLGKLHHKIRFTRGVYSMVSFGDGPVAVADEIIELIKSRMDKDGFVRIGEILQPGDRVIIDDGPLKDFTGIFECRMRDSERVLILLSMVSYQAHVEVNKRLLRKCS